MSQETLQQSYDNNSQIRTAVNRLTELVEWLHPEPSPDIFTVRDYRIRYPFTRLGPLATGDIDRYQRINRAVGNHVQMGLCEYHIGLIYLHEAAYRGAVTQFDQARQQWSFVNQSAAVSLTHLGRAVALQRADHYESALVSVGKVAGWLERARLAESVPQWDRFREKVLEYVAELQTELRKQMETAQQTAVSAQEKAEQASAKKDAGEESSSAPPQQDIAEPASDQTTIVPSLEPPDEEMATGTAVSKPISNMDRTRAPSIPVPHHRLMDDRYAWYLVEIRPESAYMPEIDVGDWLLVDMKPGLTGDIHDTEQRILVVKNEEISGTIRVRPLNPKGPFQRIYLVDLDVPMDGLFSNDEVTGAVTFSWERPQIRVAFSEILGVVIGFWRPMIAVAANK